MMGPPVLLSGGVATSASTGSLPLGANAVEAVYSGDDFVAASTGKLTQTVGTDATATEIGSSSNPSVYGQPVTYTATIKPSAGAAGVPTGTARFVVDGTAICDSVIAGGSAVCPSDLLLSPGGHDVDVRYSGDSEFSASIGSLVQQVTQASTTIDVTSDVDPSQLGQPVTFRAHVVALTPGGEMPGGVVQFFDGGHPIGDPVPLLAGTAAAPPTSALSVGVHAVTALYLGDVNDGLSGQTLFQSVRQAHTIAALSSSGPSRYGEAVTVSTALVPEMPEGGAPSGSARVTVDGVATCDSPLVDGIASCPISKRLLPGDHPVVVHYYGDAAHSSGDARFSHRVVESPSSTTLSASVNPVVAGRPVTLAATVVAPPPADASPAGRVTFTTGSMVLATVALHPTVANEAAATLTTSELAVGGHQVVATYSGDEAVLGSASAALREEVTIPQAAPESVTIEDTGAAPKISAPQAHGGLAATGWMPGLLIVAVILMTTGLAMHEVKPRRRNPPS